MRISKANFKASSTCVSLLVTCASLDKLKVCAHVQDDLQISEHCAFCVGISMLEGKRLSRRAHPVVKIAPQHVVEHSIYSRFEKKPIRHSAGLLTRNLFRNSFVAEQKLLIDHFKDEMMTALSPPTDRRSTRPSSPDPTHVPHARLNRCAWDFAII